MTQEDKMLVSWLLDQPSIEQTFPLTVYLFHGSSSLRLICMKDFSTDQLMILQNPEYICTVNLSREWSEYTVVSLWLQTNERHIYLWPHHCWLGVTCSHWRLWFSVNTERTAVSSSAGIWWWTKVLDTWNADLTMALRRYVLWEPWMSCREYLNEMFHFISSEEKSEDHHS